MKKRFFPVVLLSASICWAQEPMPISQQSSSDVQSTAPLSSQGQLIVVPAGTRIQLSLTSPIAAKSARPGYAVRAVTQFPVTVGTQLAIPVGSYVEGAIDKVTKSGRPAPTMEIHFTRILFPNGFSLPVDGANIQATVQNPVSNSPEVAGFSTPGAGTDGAIYSLAAQQSPSPAPLPRVGPNPGVVAGVGVASLAAIFVGVALLGRHRGGGNGLLFAAGWQFEMVLKNPVSIAASNIAAAMPSSPAQQ
jgi:hypothetical protein